MPLDHELDNILLPLKPSVRHSMLTDKSKIQLTTAVEGDMVRIVGREGLPSNGKHGLIRYKGLISPNEMSNGNHHNPTWAEKFQNKTSKAVLNRTSFPGTWFGIEIIVSSVILRNCNY